MGTGGLSSHKVCEAELSRPPGAEVKNVWSCTVFTTCTGKAYLLPLRKAALGPAAQPPVLPYRSAVGGSRVSDVCRKEAVQNLAGPPNNRIKFFVVFLTDHALSLQQQPILAAATSVALPTKLNVKLSLCKPSKHWGGGVVVGV